MAPPTPPGSKQAASASTSHESPDGAEDAPVSIASLRSRFELLAAGNNGPKPNPGPAARPISRPRSPLPLVEVESSAIDTGSVSRQSQTGRLHSASTTTLSAAGEPGKSILGDDPPNGGISSNLSPEKVDDRKNGFTTNGQAPDEEPVPVSVQAMKERFGGGGAAAAGPSKPRPVVPPKSAALSSRSRTALEPPTAPIIQRISTEGDAVDPESPILDRPLVKTPALEISQPLEDAPSPSLAVSSQRHPPSRPTSPKPPEPSRATKPVPRTNPSSSPTPAPQLSRSGSTATLDELTPAQKTTAPRAPPLPVRKPTLPVAALDASDDIPPPPSAPPPIPANKPRPTLSQDSAPVSEAPRLPERPRSQTISKVETALPPRPPQRQATISEPSTTGPRLPTRQSNLGSIRRAARAPLNSSAPMMDDPETLYNPPPPPSRLAAGSTPPRRSGSGPPAPNGTGDTNGVESGDEDEDDDEGGTLPAMTTQAQRMLDDFPDSTNANRRPPSFMPDVHINPTHHIHAYAVHGRHVCTASHHVKVYDTLMSSHPILVVDLKDTGIEFRIKEPRVTAMGFRPARHLADEGRYLWCGTKDGHLWELDIRTGEVTDTRQGVHNSAVSHVLRYRNYLMTLEENGKLHVFQVDTENDGPLTLSRTVRVSDRFTFAKLICGRLWTASAPPSRSTTNSASKGPTIRVYEPCAEGVMPPARTIYATEWTGAVTSATMIPFRPNEVYLAHEGGYISVWDAQEYTCLQVLKISSTDILALEGVGERLWTGNRKGQIHVYDISNKPWKTTNVWTAHHEQAIHDLHIDFRAIEDSGRFALWSCTKESLHAWDGLLSVDWIALFTRQAEYCTFREVNTMVCTWNIDSAKPQDLIGENAQFLSDCLNSIDSPDIIVFGFQEVIPLTDKKLTAKTLLFGGKNRDAGSGDKVTMAYRHWIDKLTRALSTACPGTPYVKVHSDNLVGLMTCIFVKSSEKSNLRGLDITSVKRGIGGIYGNKGAIVARMIVDDTSLCFINVHLAAGQSQKAARNADIAGIMEDKAIFPEHDLLPFVHGGDGTGIMDHEMVILNGDLNYRIDQRRENVLSNIQADELDYLLDHDQLRKEMRTNHAFRLRSFEEAPITFAPTYKYNSGTNDYDSSEKRRIPAWCDRILYRKCPGIQCIDYRRYEPTVSDHKPVSAGFKIKVKSIDKLRMQEVKLDIREEWAKTEASLLERILEALPDIL